MSYASNLDDELGGMYLDGLPPELREQAQQEKRSQGGYRFDSAADRQHIREQRGAIWAWLRGLGGHLIKHGVNLTKVPLPVELCEPRTFLERLTDSWAYLDLLHAAAAAADPVERLKLVVAFAVGGMRQQVSCDKPFNPILGETLQGVYPCGCSVAAEQVSHHPPVSCWQVRDHAGRFEYTGSICWTATFSGNSVKGSQSGESRVTFASDGASITWSLPAIHIRGVMFGDRVVKYHDTITFSDAQHGLKCELAIDPHAPRRGLVHRVLHKARHPRTKAHAHDALVGEVVRTPAGGTEGGGSSGRGKKGGSSGGGGGGAQLLDTCSGTWLTELVWDKGVRSTVLPESFDAAATAEAVTAATPAAAAGGEAPVVCHSIGSFSSSSSSSIVEEGQDGQGAGQGERALPNGAARSSSLTAGSLAAHAAAGGSSGGGGAAPTKQQPQPLANGGGGGVLPPVGHVGSAATVGSSEATGHRSGAGITVEKRLWAPAISTVYRMQRLPDGDPLLLPSDARYRPDVMALAGRCGDAAQRWKQALEQQQRADRALRAQAGVHEGGAAAGSHHQRLSSRGSDALPGALEEHER